MVFHTLAGNVVAGLPRQVSIVGVKGLIQRGSKNGNGPPNTTDMIRTVLLGALQEANLTMKDIDGFISVPSLQENHFMEAHYQATNLGLFSNTIEEDRPLRVRTIDTGGAGPVTALLEGVRMIQHETLECVAIVAADSVGSMDSTSFLQKADNIWNKYHNYQEKLKQQEKQERQKRQKGGDDTITTSSSSTSSSTSTSIPSPAIPHGYDKVTKYQMDEFGITRDQLRMAVSLESFHAGMHSESLFYKKQQKQQQQQLQQQKAQDDYETKNSSYPDYYYTSLQEVQNSPSVTPNISLLECARRADGAACFILASTRYLKRRGLLYNNIPPVVVIGNGESSGPLYPPTPMNETLFSCEEAMAYAYASAGNLTPHDIDYFGLYDCFPICLVRAIEAAGICPKGDGGIYLETQYNRMINAIEEQSRHRGAATSSSSDNNNTITPIQQLIQDKTFFPINSHGGLLCYGAPWEVPAMYSIIEAVRQLRGQAVGRQIPNCRRSLVYANGGIFSASAVAILAKASFP